MGDKDNGTPVYVAGFRYVKIEKDMHVDKLTKLLSHHGALNGAVLCATYTMAGDGMSKVSVLTTGGTEEFMYDHKNGNYVLIAPWGGFVMLPHDHQINVKEEE